MLRLGLRLSILLLFAIISPTVNTVNAQEQEKNSTKKIRVIPNEAASRIGSSVNWEDSVTEAFKKAKATGKPVFWYVPTLPDSFMDRTKEIDRYMLAGPFSWPNLISAINKNFVPVRALPTKKEQKQFQLVPYKFVEPGFLIVDPNGDVRAKVDRITTFSPEWFRDLLEANGARVPRPKQFDHMTELWASFRAGNYDVEVPAPGKGVHHAAEQLLLAGMFKFRNGKHEEAKRLWQSAAEVQPNHPLAWKAAAEAQGIGPFFRGFEVHRRVPTEARAAGVQSIGSTAPAGVYSEQQLWERSVDFLLGMQRNDGGWVDSDYDYGGTDSLSNVHVAVTSICGMALMQARQRVPAKTQAIDDAIERATRFICDDKNLNRFDRDEIIWAHAYRTRFLSQRIAAGAQLGEKLREAVEDLQSVQSRKGHWSHESYNNSWVTATALIALHEAADSGLTIDDGIVEQGCKALANDRLRNGAYNYQPHAKLGNPPAGNERSIAAAAGRMPLCDLGLWYWKKIDDQSLANALTQSFKFHENLAIAYKYDDHTSTHAYGGFFFWYDMRARSEAISRVTDDALRIRFFDQQKKLILNTPEFDGCFVDSHELGRCYGTAMALLCLGLDNRESY